MQNRLDPISEKRVENRKIVDKNYQAATRTFLFGLNPERMYPRYRQDESLDATRRSLAESVRDTPPSDTTLQTRTLNEQPVTTFARSIEPTRISSTTAEENEAKRGTLSYIKQEDRSTHNAFPKDLENTSVPTRSWSDEESSDDEELLSAKSCKDSTIVEIPCINLCNRSRVSFVVDLDELADAGETGSGISADDIEDDETLSASDEIIDSPNLDAISVPYATRTFHQPSNNDVAPWFAGCHDYDYHEIYDYPVRSIIDHVIYRNSHSLASTMDTTATLLDASRIQRNPPDDHPTKTRYVPLPEVRRYRYVTPGEIYTHRLPPGYPTFSFFPAYY